MLALIMNNSFIGIYGSISILFNLSSYLDLQHLNNAIGMGITIKEQIRSERPKYIIS
jgi:hypothetical protein